MLSYPLKMIEKAGQIAIAADYDFSEFDAFGPPHSVEEYSPRVPTELRGITLSQLNAVYAHVERRCTKERWISDHDKTLLVPETVTLYDVCKYVILPATIELKCSFVERLVGCKPQPPQWFVSHWWGEPVSSFIRCLKRHSSDHGLGDTSYWVCAYAKCQHSLEEDVTDDPEMSSFNKAIKATGTKVLSIIDQKGTTFRRAWCCLEIYKALNGTYEMYTAKDGCEAYNSSKLQKSLNNGENFHTSFKDLDVDDRDAVGITSGPTEYADQGWTDLKIKREQSFPYKLILDNILVFSIELCDATRESDKDRILDYIFKSDAENLPRPECYDKMNNMLRGRFTISIWRKMLEKNIDLNKYVHFIKESRMVHIHMSFRNCNKMNDDSFRLLLDNFPETLLDLRLDLKGSKITPDVCKEMFDKICHFNLKCLYLDGFCKPDGLKNFVSTSRWHQTLEYFSSEYGSLTQAIPKDIGKFQNLRLMYLSNNDLTGTIPKEIGECVALEWLYLQDNRLEGQIPEELGACTRLKVLNIRQNKLQGQIPASLGNLNDMFTLDVRFNSGLIGPIPFTMDGCLKLELLLTEGTGLEGETRPPMVKGKREIKFSNKESILSRDYLAAKRQRDSWHA